MMFDKAVIKKIVASYVWQAFQISADKWPASDIETMEARFAQAISEGMASDPATRDVITERRRQIEAEGWTPEHDDAHTGNQIAFAAVCYTISHFFSKPDSVLLDRLWPWGWKWWKPTDRRRDLVKAGALILAEIERLDRAAKSKRDDDGR